MVETGYENLLLVRLLVEIQIPSIRKSSVSSAVFVCSVFMTKYDHAVLGGKNRQMSIAYRLIEFLY